MTLSVIYEMWNNKDIVIPDFQRNYVWSIKQASLLIESFLLGLPVPQIFLYVDEENKYQVIDGQQRITSIVYFLDGHFGPENAQEKKTVFRLQGLNKNSPYARKRFAELDEVSQRKLKSATLRAINIRQLNPKGEATSIYHIFERLNTGGTPLTHQEIRNCVYRGEFIEVLRKLNSDKNWRKILGKKGTDRHQKDIELILRIFGLAYSFNEYEKPMKEFLNRIMMREKDGTSKEVKTLVANFAAVTEAIVEQLGEKPFHIRGPLNLAALDAVFASLLKARSIPKDLARRYALLKDNSKFTNSIFYNTSDLVSVKQRFKTANETLLT